MYTAVYPSSVTATISATVRVGIAGRVELRADVEGSDAIEGGRVILRHGGKARDGSDRRSKQKTAHHPWKDD